MNFSFLWSIFCCQSCHWSETAACSSRASRASLPVQSLCRWVCVCVFFWDLPFKRRRSWFLLVSFYNHPHGAWHPQNKTSPRFSGLTLGFCLHALTCCLAMALPWLHCVAFAMWEGKICVSLSSGLERARIEGGGSKCRCLKLVFTTKAPPKDRFLISAFVDLVLGSKAEKRLGSFGGPGSQPLDAFSTLKLAWMATPLIPLCQKSS